MIKVVYEPNFDELYLIQYHDNVEMFLELSDVDLVRIYEGFQKELDLELVDLNIEL